MYAVFVNLCCCAQGPTPLNGEVNPLPQPGVLPRAQIPAWKVHGASVWIEIRPAHTAVEAVHRAGEGRQLAENILQGVCKAEAISGLEVICSSWLLQNDIRSQAPMLAIPEHHQYHTD